VILSLFLFIYLLTIMNMFNNLNLNLEIVSYTCNHRFQVNLNNLWKIMCRMIYKLTCFLGFRGCITENWIYRGMFYMIYNIGSYYLKLMMNFNRSTPKAISFQQIAWIYLQFVDLCTAVLQTAAIQPKLLSLLHWVKVHTLTMR
jgi:hypothetical protein